MENVNPDPSPKKDQSRLNPIEQEKPAETKLEDRQSPAKDIAQNPQTPPLQNNIPDNTDINPQPQLASIAQNIPDDEHQETNIQKLNKESAQIQNKEIQMNNINQMNMQEMQMTQEQINEQIMLQYQNQINQMQNNNPDIPMNYCMLNYPQIQTQLTPEQIQYQKQLELKENKNIYDYSTNMKLYGIAFQKGNCPRLAVSSLEKRLDNKIEILELVDNELKNVYEQMVGYPCTKLLWSPTGKKSSLLAFSSDCIQIYDYSEEKQVLSFQTRLHNIKSQYCGPLTSFDWNTVNESLLGTASIDNTCTIWDLNKQTIKTQLIAHDKEVFDIQFGNDENTFISGGADGTVRLFDLRNLDHSTIIYENEGCINKIAMNLQEPNFIVALCLEKNAIYIFDSRVNSNVIMDEINLHKEPVTGCVWDPDNQTQLCSVSEDCNVIISNIGNELAQNNNVSYTAPAPINNVDWCKNFPEWIGITFQDRVQLLRK